MLFEILSYLDLKVLLPLVRLAQIVIVSLSSYSFGYRDYPEQASVAGNHEYDFVVVGAGPAGCVLANRLTEIAEWSVLLIDAGEDPPLATKNPLLSLFTQPSLPEWNYYSENDNYSSQALRTKSVHHTMGKMLGGSSSLNFMYYVRGNKVDYDGWANRGNVGWDWQNVKQYFKKIENVEKALENSSRGVNGYTGVTRQEWEHRTGLYLKGFEENGHTRLADYNSGNQMGYSAAQFFIANGIRQSAAVAYLKTAKGRRPNLHLLKSSLARKVIFNSNKTAIGVEVSLPDGKAITVTVKKEVILSAGAVNTPQLLMLSGVGPKDHLTELGIKVVHDSVNVGENLQDHMMIYVVLTGKEGFTSVVNNIDVITSWGNFPIPTLLGFAALNNTQDYPDYQTTVCPLAAGHPIALLMCSQILDLNDEICLNIITAGKRRETLQTLIGLFHPQSRGKIRLRSSNPQDKVNLYNGYFSNAQDLDNFATYLEDYLSVVNTSTFRSFGSRVVDIGIKQCSGLRFGTREYWKCYILNTVTSHYHLVGTCAMGPAGDDVVDERLRVRGVAGLRVVDASVMPTITRGNTNAPVLMIAEKAADMIKQDRGRLLNTAHASVKVCQADDILSARLNIYQHCK